MATRKFSDSDATRIISALDARADRKNKNGALVSTTWGTVGAVDDANKFASAYLYGETDGAYMSEGFRIPETMYLSVGDKVKVAINYATGERWVEEKNVSSAYKKVSLDSEAGSINFGVGTAAPTIRVYRAASSNRLIVEDDNGGLDLFSPVTSYAALRFLEPGGAARILLDYGTGTSDDFRILTATGPAGAETVVERFRVEAATGGIRLPAGSDASLSSTDHPFQIGPTSGSNIIIDNNEIMARNNGAAADLLLNGDGGAVRVGSNTPTNIRGMVAVPFTFAGTIPGSSAVDLAFSDFATNITQMRSPVTFEVVGISINLTTPRTAGTLTIQVLNGSTGPSLVGLSATIDGTTTSGKEAHEAVSGTPDVAAGSLWRCRMTTSGFTPTANNITVLLYLAVYSE